MSVFFTSDQHFGHKSIIKLCSRPFADVDDMDCTMIERWNAVVAPEDTVYHLGDFSYRLPFASVADIASKLNGQVMLVPGNHDDETFRAHHRALLPRWGILPLYYELEHEGQRMVLCHYALRTWRHDLRGVWHLYGHSHNGLPGLGKSCDVGADAWDFTPVSFERLKAALDAQPIHNAPAFANFTEEQ
jgi:calcineurin-like phosphoesterase family protein